MLQIMTELQAHCGEPTSPFSLVLPEETGRVLVYGDEVGVLAPNSEAQQ